MVKVITGPDHALVKRQALAEIKGDIGKLDEFNFAAFDMYNDLIQDAVDAALSISFISPKKVVLVENCYFLSSEMEKAPAKWHAQMQFQALENYFEHPNPEADIYLLTLGKLAGEKGFKTMAAVDKYAEIEVLDPMTDTEMAEAALRYVGERSADIDRESAVELVSRANGDYLTMINALDKLLCYTNKIRMSDLDDLVAPKLEDSVFAVVSNLFKSNPGGALKAYRDLRKTGENPVMLLNIFASQFRFMYQVSYLIESRHNDIEIGKELACSPNRVRYTRRDLRDYYPSDILAMMADLAKVEDHLKFDLDDPDTLIELFIVNFRRKYAHIK
jgi:DNA polymerase-3 subunit delta